MAPNVFLEGRPARYTSSSSNCVYMCLCQGEEWMVIEINYERTWLGFDEYEDHHQYRDRESMGTYHRIIMMNRLYTFHFGSSNPLDCSDRTCHNCFPHLIKFFFRFQITGYFSEDLFCVRARDEDEREGERMSIQELAPAKSYTIHLPHYAIPIWPQEISLVIALCRSYILCISCQW